MTTPELEATRIAAREKLETCRKRVESLQSISKRKQDPEAIAAAIQEYNRAVSALVEASAKAGREIYRGASGGTLEILP